MRFALRNTTPSRRKVRSAGAVAALALGASLMAAPQSYAASSPTIPELINACSWADYCQFHPQSYSTYTGPNHQVGSTAYNCASQTNQHSIIWSDTTASTNSVGVSITASAKFWEVYEVSVEASYRHDWTTAHTDTESDTVNIPSGYKGWIERGTAKQKATGWYELHFKSRYYGHYIWYVYNYTSTGFNVDNPKAGYINFKDAKMTSADRSAHCR